MRLKQNELKDKLKEWDKLKEEKAELTAKENAVKDALMQHLNDSGAQSVVIGSKVISKEISSHSFKGENKTIKVKNATESLVRQVSDECKFNLLDISAHKTNIANMTKKGDMYCINLLKGYGLVVVENHTLQIS